MGIHLSEFLSQRPVTRSFGVLFDLRLNKQLHKTIETPMIWDAITAHYDVIVMIGVSQPDSQCWGYQSGTLSCSEVSAAHMKFGHP